MINSCLQLNFNKNNLFNFWAFKKHRFINKVNIERTGFALFRHLPM